MTDRTFTDVETASLRRQRDLILAATGDGIYGLDVQGNTMFVNPAAARMCGYSTEDMMGANLHQLIHHSRPDGRHYHVRDCPIYAAANDGKIHRVSNEVFWRKDGSCFPVEYVSTPIWDEGNLVGAVVSFRDITEQKLAEVQATQLQQELHHISRLGAMGEMASSMAHELNQPLTAVMNYVQASRKILASGDYDARDHATEYMDKALTQAARAGDIIRGLRSFVEKGDADRSFENINEVIKEAIVLTIPGTVREWIQFEARLAKGLPETLVNKIKIQQVVVNLVRNALEAMAEKSDGKLVVTTRRTDVDDLEISVHDNGPGISDEFAREVFQSFMTTKKQGMGVGLSISRSIVEDHDGRLWAEKNAEGGATFVFTLPIVTEKDGGNAGE